MDPTEIACEFVDWIYSARDELIGERIWSQQWSLEFHTKCMYSLVAERRSAFLEEQCIMKFLTCYVLLRNTDIS
jgi:hypothetical protein